MLSPPTTDSESRRDRRNSIPFAEAMQKPHPRRATNDMLSAIGDRSSTAAAQRRRYFVRLQQAFGNQAVLRMLSGATPPVYGAKLTASAADLRSSGLGISSGFSSAGRTLPHRCSACEQEEKTAHRVASGNDEDVVGFPRQVPSNATTPAPAPGVSPPSPPPPAASADCCTQALNSGLDKGDYGGIICCQNSKNVCIWTQNVNRVVTNATAQPIVAGCVRVHEATHRNQVDCTGAAVERPSFKDGVDPKASECAAYKVEVPCYENKIDKCGTDADCRKQVQVELDFARKQVKRFCGT